MPKRNLIWLAAIIGVTAVIGLVLKPHRTVSISARKRFWPVVHTYTLIKDHYVEPTDDKNLARKAISAMVGELDEFSAYIPPERVGQIKDHMTGLGHGLGLEIEYEDSDLKVLGARPGSSAWRSGICTGDEIVEIDNRPVNEMADDEVRKLLNPSRGGQVVLRVRRGDGRTRTVTLSSGEYSIQTVVGLYRGRDMQWAYRLPALPDENPDGISPPAYVRVKEFVRTTGEQFRRAVRQASLRDGMILDLRDNPGGLLPAAVQTADMFLHSGPVVTVVARDEPPREYQAHADGTLHDGMLAVLVNSRTASAAELLAGALQEGGRAVIIGLPTRGKHCIQSMFPLGNEMGQLNLTTSRFFLGRYEPQPAPATQSARRAFEPISPDVLVGASDEHLEAIRRFRLRQEVLRRAGSDTPDAEAPDPPVRRFDPQLAAAEKLLQNRKKYYSIIARRKHRNAERKRQAWPDHDDRSD